MKLRDIRRVVRSVAPQVEFKIDSCVAILNRRHVYFTAFNSNNVRQIELVINKEIGVITVTDSNSTDTIIACIVDPSGVKSLLIGVAEQVAKITGARLIKVLQ